MYYVKINKNFVHQVGNQGYKVTVFASSCLLKREKGVNWGSLFDQR